MQMNIMNWRIWLTLGSIWDFSIYSSNPMDLPLKITSTGNYVTHSCGKRGLKSGLQCRGEAGTIAIQYTPKISQ